jgi:hypothetical protein
MAENEVNPLVAALKHIFGPIIGLSEKLPPVLAYSLGVLIAILVTVTLGAVVPDKLLWPLVVIVVASLGAFILLDRQARLQAAERQSSIAHILNSAILSVVVHEQGDQTSLIPDAQVTLALPEPTVKKTDANGATNFIISNQLLGKEFALNAQKPDYKKRRPRRIVLRPNAYEFIPLEPEQVREKEPERDDKHSERGLDEPVKGKRRVVYESESEGESFISWGLFADDGRFYDHIAIVRRPTDGMATFEQKAGPDVLVGVNKSLRVLHGRTEFEYQVVYSNAEGPNIFFCMIPMQETGPGRSGLIEVGTNVEDDPRNAFSPYRQRFVVPIEHFGDGQWHHGSVEFDFRHTPEAFYSIFGPRINEGSVHPGAGHVLFTNVRVLSDEI